MNPKALALQDRTRKFAAAVIRFCEGLPKTAAAREIAGQLIDSSGSTDSNYRAACRGRTNDEFIAKLGVAVEEADESKGWLELLVETDIARAADVRDLIQEADELTAIFVASRKTAERRREERDRVRRHLAATRRSGRRP
jgi:four helix bundle protein